MSQVALFVRLPTNSISALRKAAKPTKWFFGAPKDNYWKFLNATGGHAAEYEWSGWTMIVLLSCLQDTYQIDLLASSQDDLAKFLTDTRGTTHVVLTQELKDACLDRLNPANFTLDELRDAYNAFEEADEPEAGRPMLDGVKALHDALSAVDDSSVVLLIVG